MRDLPATVTFDLNPDHFAVDQGDDVIKSVQAFHDDSGRLTVELWGTTTVITPEGNRDREREFQQDSVIEFDGRGGFGWRATRRVFGETHSIADAPTFELVGTEHDVAGRRRV